jgi:serine protease AprX
MTSFVHGRMRPLASGRAAMLALLLTLAVASFIAHVAASSAPETLPAAGSSAAASSSAASSAAPGPGGHGTAAAPLRQLAAAHPRGPVEVIIQLRAGVRPAQGQALVRSAGGRPGPVLTIINGLSARMTAAGARHLAESPLVRAVSLNVHLRTQDYRHGPDPSPLATTFDDSVNATNVWRRSTGAGVGVAVIDTGITGDLPDFRSSRSSSSRVIASAVIDPGATSAGDTYGHGTAVAGLIGGDGDRRDSGDSLQNQYAGTAPDANLISIKVADDSGQSTILDAIYGLQFAVDHRDAYNIGVVNLSFRSTSAESAKTDPLDAAVEQAWLHGIVVVAASGNLGDESDAVDFAPANDPYALTVGAVDENGTGSTSDDTQASWSSRGQTQDGLAKPDVLAPGAHIVTTLAPGSYFAGQCPSCVIGGSYFQVSGTSLAAPIVAGIAADLIAAHPDWTPNQIKGAIVNTATSVDGGSEVNAWNALWAGGGQLSANQGLTPSTLIDPSTGDIDYSTASWSTASWSTATDSQTASWSTASWSCLDCSADTESGSGDGSTDPTTASWSTLGWTTMWG